MYRYDEFDHQLVAERVEQFRGQVARRVAGEITEDAFKPPAADEWCLFAITRLYAARRHTLWHTLFQANADAGSFGAQI